MNEFISATANLAPDAQASDYPVELTEAQSDAVSGGGGGGGVHIGSDGANN
jgi:hypothetical protein